MRLVIGLGNPGIKYMGTRHNVGFDVLNELAKRYGAGAAQKKYQSDVQDVMIHGEKVLLVAPLTFMNLSGDAVWQHVKFYQPEASEIVVICDDMNLPAGRIRWRASGSAGGQKGLSHIIQRLGHQEFPRLRIGVGRPPGRMDATTWVLGRFRDGEQDDVKASIVRAADSIESWCARGIEATMNEFNRNPDES
ncbi:MAG: aminoacyl-tRNA hydrolase [Planctomycetaceae bacterium]